MNNDYEIIAVNKVDKEWVKLALFLSTFWRLWTRKVTLEKHQKSFFATYEHLREISIVQIDGHTRR